MSASLPMRQPSTTSSAGQPTPLAISAPLEKPQGEVVTTKSAGGLFIGGRLNTTDVAPAVTVTGAPSSVAAEMPAARTSTVLATFPVGRYTP